MWKLEYIVRCAHSRAKITPGTARGMIRSTIAPARIMIAVEESVETELRNRRYNPVKKASI